MNYTHLVILFSLNFLAWLKRNIAFKLYTEDFHMINLYIYPRKKEYKTEMEQ